MKENNKRFIGSKGQSPGRSPVWLKLVAMLLFATLAGLAGAQPANDNFTNAAAIGGYSGTTNGINNGATPEACEPTTILFDDLTNVDNSVWYKWTAPSSGAVEFDTIGSSMDTVLVAYTIPAGSTNGLCDTNLAQIAADDNYTNSLGVIQTNSQLTFKAVAGRTYYVSVNGNAGAAPYDAGSFVLNWNMPLNDNFTNAIAIWGVLGTTNGNNSGATLELPCEPTNIVFGDLTNVDKSVWYSWTAPAYGTLTVDTIGSRFDTVLAVYTTNVGGVCGLVPVAANDNYTTNSTSSRVSFPVTLATTYFISVNGNAGAPPLDEGNFNLDWSFSTTATNSPGTLGFTLGSYAVSETDSTGPNAGDGGTVSAFLGARLTVTRTGNASGRVKVDYSVSGYSVPGMTYTNTFITNNYSTNITVLYIGTNGLASTTNYIQTFTITTNLYGFYDVNDGGYLQYSVTGADTNFTYWFTVDTTNTFTNSVISSSSGAIVGPPPVFPATNFVIGSTNLVPSPARIFSTNFFSYQVTNSVTNVIPPNPSDTFLDPSNNTLVNSGGFYTNTVTSYFGSNVTFAYYYYPGGAEVFSNYYYTNIVIYGNGYITYTNSGTYSPSNVLKSVFLSGTTNALQTLSVNNPLILSNNVGSGTIALPGGGSIPTPGVHIGLSFGVFNSDGSETVTFTNVTGLPQVSTNMVVSGSDGINTNYTGTLTFDDFQMSQDIALPVNQALGPDVLPDGVTGIPSIATVYLSNPRLDPLESTDLQPPTLGVNSSTLVNALSTTFNNPLGAAIFNFERSTLRVDKDVGGGQATITVLRSGDAPNGATVQYRIDYGPGANEFHSFQLQAGSDYANPDNQPNPDFQSVSGTLTFPAFPAAGWDNQQFSVPIQNNGLVEFNEDMQLQLYNAGGGGTPGATVGEVGTANLTILFDDFSYTDLGGQFPGQQPAGAADRSWNQNLASDSVPPFLNYPGTQGSGGGSVNGNGGTVYAVAEQTDGKVIIAGSFISFDSNPYNRIVRLLNNGYQDTTFLASPNSGANDFIAALALYPSTSTNAGKVLIGGNFTSFNGVNRYHVARLNSDGSLDTTFNPGTGASGMVWSIALQANEQLVIGGSFGSYNGTNINAVARLNGDGSLDTSFNPGAGPNGTVRAVVVDAIGRVIVGGDFDSVSGSTYGGVARLNVDGSLDTSFNPGIGTYNPETGFNDPVYALALQPNGQLLVGGDFSYVDLDSYNGLVRLNTDGTVDTGFHAGTGTFNPVTHVADSVQAIILQPDGTILVGGDFTTFNQTRRVGLTRLYPDGTVDTSFMDTAYNQFAGLINHYHNPNAVNTVLYPEGNTRNFVDAIAQEWFTNVVNTANLVTNNSVVTTNFVTTTNVTGGNVIIGGSFLRVGGGFTRDDTRPRSNVARLIGPSTPGPGNIQFSYNNYTVDKNAGTLFVSLVRSATNTNNPSVLNNLGVISAMFSTNMAAPGPGIASATNFSLPPNYTEPTWPTIWSVNQNYSWMYNPGVYGPNYLPIPTPPGAGAEPSVYLTLNNNTNISGNLNANLALSGPAGTNFLLGGEYIPLGAALGWQQSAPLTIIEDNIQPGVLGFSAPTYTVNQNGTNATITVVRTNGTDGVVQISYATGDGTGTNGVDYTAVSGTLTFAQGVSSQSFTIPIINGVTVQPDKTVNLTLNNVTGGATFGLTNAVLTIINNNFTAGHVSFTSATYSTNENLGTALITVNRLGGSSGTLTVNIATSDGTAVNGVNYVGSTNILTWNNNDVSTKTFAVPLIHDGLYTSNLTVNLSLYNATVNTVTNANGLGLLTNATLSIINVDFPGTVQFSSGVYSVKKSGGFALIPVVRTGGSAGTITVTNYTFDGTATNGVNYLGTTNLLTFTNGQVSQFFTVPILNNTNVTGPLFLSLVLGNAVPTNSLGSPGTAVLNIIDTTTVNETAGSDDDTYSSFAGFNGPVFSMVLQPNNQLLVGGDFTQANGVPRQRIARLNADGSLDAAFSLPSSTWGADATVRALAVQSDGRILVGGFFTNFNTVAQNRVARLNQDGSLDSLFNFGSGADNPVYGLAETFVGGQRKILLAGGFATINGAGFNGVARLNDDGTPDTGFNAGGLGANATVYALAVYPTNSLNAGQILIGGDFTAVNGTSLNHIARLNPDGSVDTTFNAGTGANGTVNVITIQLDGRILIGGSFTNVNGTALNRIARLNNDGSVDGSFTSGLGANDTVLSIALQTDTRIVLGGQFTQCSGVTRSRITRLNPDGTVDPTINFGTGADGFVAAIAIQEDTIAGYPTNVPDEKIIIGGGFTHYDGVAHDYIKRIFGGSIGGVGAFQFSSANYQVDENGTNVVITVIRTGGTSSNVFVPFATSNGTAVNGVNYTGMTTNLNFPQGEVIQTITIPVMDDLTITSNLTVNLAIYPTNPPEQYGNQPTAVLTIVNDDSAVLFSSATYQVAKNVVSGVATINLLRLGGTNGTSTVVFNTTTNGTALVGTDYSPLTNTLVTFNPGVTNIALTIPINNNGIPEGNQTVTLQLSNAVGSLLYSPSNATLTIIDTVFAPGDLSFATNNYAYHATDINAYLTVVRTNGFSGTVSASYATAGGTAVPGVDYVPTNGTVTFGDGVTNQVIAVPLINNGLAQGPVTVSVVLSNPTGGATLVAPASATVTILNTNTVIVFQQATNTVAENGAFVTLNVLRLNNSAGTVTVNYSSADGTAIGGVNYLPVFGTLTFTNGQTSQTITVPLIDDSHVTGDLQFNVQLSNPTGARLIAPSTTTVIVQDADAGFNFIAPTLTVLKSGTNAVLAVVGSNPRVEPVSVDYFTADGSATNGIDYTAASGTLLFANGTTTNYITVPILDNSLLEGTRTFSVALTNATYPGQLFPPSVETVTILDSNPGVSFSSPAYTVVKTGVQALINVYRTGYTDSVMSVNFATADGTAAAGSDYVATNGVLVFTNGVTNLTFTVPVVNHVGVQPPRTVQLSLLNPTNAVLTSPTNALLTILNSTNTVLAFAFATNSVAENAGFAALTVLRLNNTNGTVTANYATTNGTATAGTNYTATGGTLTFTNGQTSQTIIVPLIYNPQVTGDLQFTVGLSNPTNTLLITPSATTVIEQDADAGLSFTSATNSVLKNATNAVISVVCSNPRVEPITVNYLTADGTASNGVDYVGLDGTPTFSFTNNIFTFNPGYGTLFFTNGLTTNTFTIPIINNSIPGNRTFSVYLFGPTGTGQLVAPSVQTVTIIDSNPQVSFSSPAYAVANTGVQATINVYRTGYTDSVMSVNYQTANGTAISGSDYVATSGTLVFTNGVTNQTFSVTVINQGGAQPPKTVQLSLLNVVNGQLASPAGATLTILNNTNAAFTFAAAATTSAASAGSVTLNVLRLNNTNGTATVNYATADGTATSGTNYTGTNGTLTFAGGVISQTVTVPLINNTNLTGNFQFTVGLANPSSPAQLIAPSSETVVVQYAAPVNTQPTFANPLVIGGNYGSSTSDNTANASPFGSNLVWFAWTPTNSGEVEFDTIGSVDDVLGVTNLATYMGVYTGSNISTLNQVVINAGIYQDPQLNYSGQNIFSVTSLSNGVPVCLPISGQFYQPFAGPSPAGPSIVRFNAVAGQTYYVVVETYQGLLSEAESGNATSAVPVLSYNTVYSPPSGLVKLNWALHPSGVFRFAAEDYDETGLTYSNGIPMQLYRVSETEQDRRPTGSVNAGQYESTFDGTTYPTNGRSGYNFDVPGLLVTVTRTAGSSGRVQVGYTTEDIPTNSMLMGTNGYLLNGDLPASSTFNFNNFNLNQFFSLDYTPVSGVLTFDDSEVSKTIFVPIQDDFSQPRQNRDFLIILTNAVLDAAESTGVQPPRLDNNFSQTLVRILDTDIDPKGPSQSRLVVTNIDLVNQVTNVTTNVVWNLQPTNGVYNFQKAHYRVTRDIANYWGGTPITVYVNRMGTNDSASPTIYWRVNNFYLDKTGSDLRNGQFPLQPGSDYATPDPANSGDIEGLVPDFQFTGGAYSGSFTFPSGNGAFNPHPITFTIYDNGLQQFNEDFQVNIYEEDKNGNPIPAGMVDQTTVTILTDDNHPPAGSVDEFHNTDFSYNLAGPVPTVPPQMSHPGTDGEVFGVAVQPDNKTILVGDFFSYDLSSRNCIARANFNGGLDTSFNPGSGANDFISSVALTPYNEVLIGGNFSSYNGSLRNGIALVNTNGALDNSFNPGLGFNGTVNTVVEEINGKALVGGNFTSYNGTPRHYLARLNADGSLDTTFDPGTVLNGPVNAIAEPTVTLTQNIARNAAGANPEDDNYISVGALSGTLTVGYNFYAGTNDMRVFYGGTNGVLIFDTGLTNTLDTNGNSIYITNAIPFGPTNGLYTNIVTIVMNQGNVIPGFVWDYTASVTVTAGGGNVIVGGDFTSAGGISGQDHIARLFANGTFDPSFDPGSGANAPVFALAVQPDGNVLVGGEFSEMNGTSKNNLARLSPGGFLDPNFYSGTGADGPVYNFTVQTSPVLSTTNSGAVVQTNFTIYVGGAFTAFNGTHRLGFTRLNADGTVDTTFMDTAYNEFAGLPRERYGDPIGTVLASGIQSDGNVMIGGSFERVGGGQSDDVDVRPESIDTNDVLIAESYVSQTQKTRSGIRNRSNFARLIGGATPGPGNIGLLYNNYSINKSQTPLYVSLIRTNGSLGTASANFAVLPGLAQSGVDYSYSGLAPLYWTAWEDTNPSGRMHSDGFFGTNGFVEDVYGRFFSGSGQQSTVEVTIIENTNSLNNLSANFQLTDPVGVDQFYLGGQNIPLGVALGASSAPLALIDDHHQSGTFGFASPSYTGTGQGAAITVTRTNGSYGNVSLNYATTTNGSTAVLGSDYTAASGTLTFQPTDTNIAFNVPILSSNYNSAVEKYVNLNLSGLNPPFNGLASYGLTNAVLRIINPNFQGFLNLSTNAYFAGLSAGSVSVTVTRTVGGKGTLTVQLATANGTAINGTDYIGTTNTLQWNDGDVSPRTVTIPLVNNHAIGSNRQFGVALSNPQLNGVGVAALLGATTNATVTIVNDNSYGTLQFSAPSYVVNEDGGYSTVTVIRTGTTNGTVTVNFATADVTAHAATNYVATNGILTFVPGQIAASVNVRILDDGKTNPPPASFFFQVSLSNLSAGATLGSPANANVNIVDAESFNRPPGQSDSTFNAGAGMNADVFALALQSDGQILAGGDFTTVNGVPENNLARLNTDGSLDRSGFLYGLAGANAAVYAVVDQTDDQILIGGAFTNFNGTVLNRIARLNSDGSQDSSFNPGAGADNTIYALAETFSGGSRKVYAGGAFSIMNGVSRPYIARLNNDGTVDTAFSTGTGPNAQVYAVAVYPTNSPFAGKLLIGGAFTNINSFAVGGIARLNADGSIDANFDTALNASGTVRAVALQSDGRILIGGDFTNVDGVALNHLARLNADGSLDATFTTGLGAGANGTVNAIVVQADNRIVVAGQFTLASGVTRNRITRLNPDGTVDPTINFGDGANGAVNAVVVQPADQFLVIGGSFTQYNDQTAGHVARIYGGSQTGSGLFEFTSAGYQVDENGVQALIGIRRTGGTSGTNADGTGDVFVNFATHAGTAVAGVNYSNVNVNLDYPAGEVLKIVPIPVMDDSNITPNLTVNLALTNATPPAGLGDQATAVLTIVNDDNAVSFASANFSVAKNILTGFGLADVTRLGTTNGTCTVDYFTATNGSAVIGTDYYPTNGTITFNPGDTDKLIQIPVINNDLPEGNRTVALVLTNVAGSLLIAPSNSILTIIDTVQAPGQLSFSATNYVVKSSDGTATITVVRTNGTSGSVSAAYNTVPGTAVAGIHYQTVSGTVTFNDGDTNKTFTVPLIYNAGAQPDVNLSVVLSSPTGGATLISPTNATVTIVNTNTVFYFAAATNNAPENSGFAGLTVLRNNTNTTASVNYTTADGTAVANANYIPESGTLTFTNGQFAQTIIVPLIYNPQVTGDLLFTAKLSSPSSGAFLSLPSTTVVDEQDADAGLSFTNATMSVLKNGTNAVITVVCSNPRVEPVTVGYYTTDGTATNGVDYVATNGVLVFTNGISTNTFNVALINNNLLEGSTTFTVTLTNATAPGKLTSPTVQTVTILDSNPGVSFSSSAYTVVKTVLQTLITVYRTGYTNSVMTVNYATADGTATNGVDYVGTSGTLVFTNGVTNLTFTVGVVNQLGVQPPKTVLLSLSNPTNGVLASPTNATLTILNSTNTVLTFALATNSVPENSGFAALTVLRLNNTNGVVTVNYATADGTATAGTNYTAESGTITFTNGQTSTNIIVPLIYNPLVTGDLKFTVGLSSPSSPAQLIAPSVATVIEQDANAGLSFTNATMSVLKNGTNAVITVVCSNPRVEPVTVGYYTTDGTATNGVDYVATNGVLVFTNGISTNTFNVALINNNLLEGSTTFTVTLTNATAPAALGSPSVQTVTILDSNPGVSFSSPAYTAIKTDLQALITVYRTGYTNSVMTVNYATADGTGTNGSDYVGTSGTLVFTNGVTNATFTVTLINQLGVQPPKTVLLSLSNPTNGVLTAPTNATLTILNDTNTVLAFAVATNSVPENAGYVALTVLRLNNTNGTVTVNYATTNGTAVAGVNYTVTSGTLTFTNGQTSTNIVVPLIYDPALTGDLQFTVGLSSPSSPAELIAPTVATVIEQDANTGLSFTNATLSVLKNGTNAVITVVCSNPRVEPVTVDYFTADGTATNGIDYVGTNGTLVFTNGITTNTFVVPIINNNLLEGNTTFTVALTNASLFGILTPPSVLTVTIIDSNPGLSFSSPAYSTIKTNGQATITVYRTGYTNSVVSVGYTTADGTGTNGIDYVGTSGTLVLTNGVTNATFTVTVINQLGVQPPKTVLLALTNPVGALLTYPSNAVLTIYDAVAGFAFAAVTNAALENSGSIGVNVIRSGNLGTTVQVSYSTTNNGTAQVGVNYTPVSGILTFTNGETLRAITVPLIDDPLVTGNLTFGVNLFNPGTGSQLLSPSNTTVVVEDVDAGLSFATNNFTVLKNAGTEVITVVCSNPNAEPVSVNYATADGTATNGINYLGTSGTLTFTNGVTTNTFTVPIINNTLLTGNLTFGVTLSSPTAPGQLVSPSVATVTIIDSNSGLSFDNANYSINKNGIAATINVIRTGYTNSTVSVNFLATNGTALAGVNYFSTNGTVTFTNGVTSQSFTVQVINTTAVQPDETVLLLLSNPVGASLVPPSASLLTIHDTSGSYVIPAGSALISETGAGAPNGIIDPNETVVVLFSFRDAGGTNVANLVATLLATNGVTSVSPASESYGPLAYGRHSLFRPFQFTALGTNGQQINATFQLQDGVKPIGSAVVAYTLGEWTNSYANTNRIIINDVTYATPYPSIISVGGVGGSLFNASVTVTNLSHQSASDVNMLLVAPNQKNVLFMSHAGGINAIVHVTLQFADSATNSLPQSTTITNGLYKPTAYLPVPSFP